MAMDGFYKPFMSWLMYGGGGGGWQAAAARERMDGRLKFVRQADERKENVPSLFETECFFRFCGTNFFLLPYFASYCCKRTFFFQMACNCSHKDGIRKMGGNNFISGLIFCSIG
jgi:hypothetical protein